MTCERFSATKQHPWVNSADSYNKMLMGVSVCDRLQNWLKQHEVPYTVLRHEPVFTSEQAAAVRGTSLASGAKALVVKAGERFVLLVLPADRKLDSRKARDALAVKALRFASKEEVQTLTSLQPGAIPPFGSLFQLPSYCDPALGENPSINFNAGDHAISIQMAYSDYIRGEKPQLISIT
jgi:Ala-tRNA(Pro) deacylase